MIIRKMTFEDVKTVAQIEKECFSLPWSEASFEDSLAREDTVFLVCEDLDVVGYIGMYLSFEEGEITNVAVTPSYRQRGCGNLLIQAIKEEAKARAAESVILEVRVSNVPAISLYKKHGFEEIGIRKNFYEHPSEDAIIMKVGI
ncbi:MAG: ribosomal-protein-alanine N-acetyltransferase [Lachnospiraceae bacterium]|nr:ribosomal-protein-alanine N-acetyltransferase [Lachnospiraceae bacterium]